MEEEKNRIKVSLGMTICIFIIVILLIIIGVMYFYYNYIRDNTNNSNNMVENEKVQETNRSKNDIIEDKEPENNTEQYKEIYQKYGNLYWIFNDTNSKKVEFAGDKITIKNGVAYLQTNGKEEKIDTIRGKVKYVTGWGEQSILRVYALTEDGQVWKSICGEDKGERLNNKFSLINIEGKVINMTNGEADTRVVEPPYFLLATGELINEDGSYYEELNKDFKNSFGSINGTIYVSQDNTLSYYNEETREYIKVVDENGEIIKMKDGFIQYSSIHNDLVNETDGNDRIFIQTDKNQLLYFDGYREVIAKDYKEATNKSVKSIIEEKENGEHGGHITNVRVTFTDGTEILIKDVSKIL